MKPCNARISQDYGEFPQASGQPWIHVGIDYAGSRGEIVVTISEGTVLFAGPGELVPNWLADTLMLYRGSTASGNCVIVQHDGWVETFNHLEFYLINTGDTVKRGFRVGGMGDSGNAFGVHLHYETLTTPASAQPPFSRYNPHLQMAYEDERALETAPKNTPVPPVVEKEWWEMPIPEKERKALIKDIALEVWGLRGTPRIDGVKQTMWGTVDEGTRNTRELRATISTLTKLLSEKTSLTEKQITDALKEGFIQLVREGVTPNDPTA